MVQQGSAFEMFLREHSTGLLRTSFLLTGDVNSAEDLLQDALVRLYPNWGRVVAAQAPVAYVRRCLLNEYLNSRRRRALQIVDIDVDSGADDVPDVGDGIAARDETNRLLALLNDRQRAAVVLRYFHDFDDTEIAETLGCRRATVRSLVSRGLLAMRGAHGLAPVAAEPKRTAS